jgi:hypothetical protein
MGTGPTLLMLMLNPSDADEEDNDPTVGRQVTRGTRLGYGELIVANIFGFVTKDPAVMSAQEDPVGPENDRYILQAAREAQTTVCAWGTNGVHRGRDQQVIRLLRGAGIHLHYLRLTKDGHPMHPLYLPLSLAPTPWPV